MLTAPPPLVDCVDSTRAPAVMATPILFGPDPLATPEIVIAPVAGGGYHVAAPRPELRPGQARQRPRPLPPFVCRAPPSLLIAPAAVGPPISSRELKLRSNGPLVEVMCTPL